MIGVFDSGLGGLTVLDAIRAYAPKADLLYFGDTKNAPYGNRTREEVRRLTINGVQKLLDEGATQIVSACNSVSISLDAPILDALSLDADDIIEMVGPTVRALKERDENRILLCATAITIASGVYQEKLTNIGKEITELPLPLLVSYIESGKSTEDIEKLLQKYISEKDISKQDLVLLGCTHFPLVEESFKKVFSIPIYNPASAVAREVAAKFNSEGNGSVQYLFSKETKQTKAYTKRTL